MFSNTVNFGTASRKKTFLVLPAVKVLLFASPQSDGTGADVHRRFYFLNQIQLKCHKFNPDGPQDILVMLY